MRHLRLAKLLFVAMLVLTMTLDPLATPAHAANNSDIPEDRVGLRPADVVRMQLQALQTNGDSDDGIALVWEFTSPDNQAANGPLDRFAQMIHRVFGDLLNSQSFELGPTRSMDGGVSVPVRLICEAGNLHGYLFWLSMDHQGSRDGHWLTEGVTPVRVPQSSSRQPPHPPTPPRTSVPPEPPHSPEAI